jgi:hypothetical protein
MSWRGARLSGDRERRHSTLWGVASVVTFVLALIVGAIANHDSRDAIRTAQDSARDSHNQLVAIQGSLGTIQDAMAKIAGAAKIDPNQSAQALADQIIDELSALQAQIAQTASRVTTLEHPPHNPDFLYQDDKVVASFIREYCQLITNHFNFLKYIMQVLLTLRRLYIFVH